MTQAVEIEDIHREIEYDRFSLAKWSPLASEINRDEFLGISFSHHMEILHKTKNIDEVLFCIHEAVTHQWDKYTLREILKAIITSLWELLPIRLFQICRKYCNREHCKNDGALQHHHYPRICQDYGGQNFKGNG